MGGCATKPKVLKADDAPQHQVTERKKSKEEAEREPVTESKPRDTFNVEQQANEKVVAEDEGGKGAAEMNDINNKVNEIVGGDDKIEEQGGKRRSLSLLFNKESQEGNIVAQGDNAPPEELKRQEPMEAKKILAEAQSSEPLKPEATNNDKSSVDCGKDKGVPLETQKTSGEFESIEQVKKVTALEDHPTEIVKNELPTEPEVEKAGKAESSETSVAEQEPREVVKLSCELVKEEPSNANETSEESDTKFLETETKLEEPSNVNETCGQSDTKFVEAVTKLEEPSNVNETSGQSDTKFVEAETMLEEPSNVDKTSGQSDTKFVEAEAKLEEPSNVDETSGQSDTNFDEAEPKLEEPSNVNEISEEYVTKFVDPETVENPVELSGIAVALAPSVKDVTQHTNQFAVEVQSDEKVAKETTESFNVKKTSEGAYSQSSDANNKTSGESHNEPSDVYMTSGEPHSESYDVKKTSVELDGRDSEVKPLEKPGAQIGLAVTFSPSEEEGTEHNNPSAEVVQNDDKPAKAIA